MQTLRAIFLIVLVTVLAGCTPRNSQPAASTLAPMDQQSMSQVGQSYRASHPGSEVGVVNAAIPERRIISVGGIAPERVHRGDLITILESGQRGANVPAVVYDKASGYIQLWYSPLPTGQAAPKVGDIAVWTPGATAVPLEEMTPPPLAPSPSAIATQPAIQEQATPPPNNAATPTQPALPPATIPETTLPPASMPASAPSGERVFPTTSATTHPASDFNK